VSHAYRDVGISLGHVCGDRRGHVHRAVLPSGAAEGHSEAGEAAIDVPLDVRVHDRADVLPELPCLRLAFQPFPDKAAVMSYYEVPADVLEDREALAAWAQKALQAASRKRKK